MQPVMAVGEVFCSEACANEYTIGSGQKVGDELQALNDVQHYSDLCILSYQLYAQTTKWRIDPFTECIEDDDYRSRLFAALREQQWSYGGASGVDSYGGRSSLDAIAFNYNGIDPRASTYYNGGTDEHIYFQAPKLTARIDNVYYCTIDGTIKLSKSYNSSGASGMKNTDDIDLYCFEGETGISARHLNKGGQKSLLGYIIYDKKAKKIDIAFRGSRSGNLVRGFKQGYGSGNGNADWVTDTDSMPGPSADYMTEQALITGLACNSFVPGLNINKPLTPVCYGFAHALLSCKDSIQAILKEIFKKENSDGDIKSVGITGHSLGGGIATLCKIMLKQGTYIRRYLIPAIQSNPTINNDKLDSLLRVFSTAKCFTFGAPSVVDAEFNLTNNIGNEIQRYRLDKDAITKGNGYMSAGSIKHIGEKHNTVNIMRPGGGGLAEAHMPQDIRNSHYIMRCVELEKTLNERGLKLNEGTIQRASNLENLWIQEKTLSALVTKKPAARMAFLSAFRMDHFFMLVDKLINIYLWWFHGHSSYTGSAPEWRKKNYSKFKGFRDATDFNTKITKDSKPLEVLALIHHRLEDWNKSYASQVHTATKSTSSTYDSREQKNCPFFINPYYWYLTVNSLQEQLEAYLNGYFQKATTVIKYVNKMLKDLAMCLKGQETAGLTVMLNSSIITVSTPTIAAPTAAAAGGGHG